MLKEISLQNILLMESCSIEWSPNFTVITGETGSGKTAILHGLRLLLGQKLDTSLIRRGESKGFVQAVFEFTFSKELTELLTEAGIPVEDSFLILSREISAEGKSKSWINQRLVSISFLQKVGAFCVEIIDQNSSGELRSSELQREILDEFGCLQEHTKQFESLMHKAKSLEEEWKNILDLDREKQRELDFCLQQIKELNQVELKDGEEDLLFQEYTTACQTEEISTHIDQIFELINQSPSAILLKIQQIKNLCKPYSSRFSCFEESLKLLESCTVSLKELQHILRNALSDFDPNPQKKEFLEKKLSLIDRLKKKYGPTPSDWNSYRKKLEEKIEKFETIEEQKIAIRQSQDEVEAKLSHLADFLSEQRTLAAKKLSDVLSHEIQSLNMQGALLTIEVKRSARSLYGENSIDFWLKANQGEKQALVKESASGGELARLLLALKLTLAGKNQTPTLIFDEIDAGVGGETARLIGEQLKRLSTNHQIICITHFPQLACLADLHLQVSKNSEGDRTYATIKPLDFLLREIELVRMLGGKKNSFIL